MRSQSRGPDERGASSLRAHCAELPYNEYYEYFGPDYQLHITPSNMENLNTPKYLERIQCVARASAASPCSGLTVAHRSFACAEPASLSS